MALPILDGNQTATTLATTVSGGAHYPNHILASAVTIGSLPAISGTVTANVDAGSLISALNNFGQAYTAQIPVGIDQAGFGDVPISGTVTANISGAVFSGISGEGATPPEAVAIGWVEETQSGANFNFASKNYPFPISGTVTANVNYEGVLGGNLPEKLAVIAGYVSEDSEIRPLPLYTQQDFGQQNNRGVGVHVISSPNISGTVTASVTNSVTIGSLPRPTWTDYSGTIVTAGEAVTAINTTTRSYLLAQVTTGQMFVNIGATATTLNSVYFSAGQGFAWETSVPQGIVSIISAVTGTNYVLKDG